MAGADDDPHSELTCQGCRRAQLFDKRGPVEVGPALDLGFGATRHRPFGEMDELCAVGVGLSHEPPDLSTILANVGRDPTLGRGDLEWALAHPGISAGIRSREGG